MHGRDGPTDRRKRRLKDVALLTHRYCEYRCVIFEETQSISPSSHHHPPTNDQRPSRIQNILNQTAIHSMYHPVACRSYYLSALCAALLLLSQSHSLSLPVVSRRDVLGSALIVSLAAPSTALAAADCFQDCVKNCQQIAPKNADYCQMTCQDYCDQDDRADGLSGSVSNEGGEVGILGGTFGTGTVVKGQDKPPEVKLPGLDFMSGDGKKLIGY